MTSLYDQTKTCMRVGLHLDGKSTVWLLVPTFFDDSTKTWSGAVQTPETKKLIYGSGKDSRDLEQSFNAMLKECLSGEIADEVFSMFKSLEYWEAREQT